MLESMAIARCCAEKVPWRTGRLAAAVFALALFVGACASSEPPPSATTGGEYDAIGNAAWYGPPYHGRRTASGEIFDMNAMTAAHPTLRFGTLVRVTNLDNGRSAILRVNDRSQYRKGRIIDVSRRGAEELGFRDRGVTRVHVRAIGFAPGEATAAAAPPRATPPRSSPPPRATTTYDVTGTASWYGHPYHGRQTASGEIFDMRQMTAAHRDLPFGTRVHVTNLENGRSVVVRINDRGPFKPGRIIDVSRRAAEELGFLGSGLTRVRVRAVDG